jgi:TIR domain
MMAILRSSFTGGLFNPQPKQGLSYDVAISYAHEDIEIADAIANRLRQDGYRCFYNPNRLHKLLGLSISDALLEIYGRADTQVIALISTSYLTKEYPMKEFAAATRSGPERVIPVKIGNAQMPSILDETSYADHSAYGTDTIAIQVSQALTERIGQPEELGIPQEREGFSVDMIAVLDNPRRPYALQDVEFFDTGEKYLVDISSDTYEFDDPRHYINRGLGELRPENAFANVSREDVQAAKNDVRAHIAERDACGWPIFNGKKFGVARIRRTRQSESEYHRLIVNIYETDYLTSLFTKKLYNRLNPQRLVRIDRNQDLSQYSGLLASFGFDILLFLPYERIPHVLITKRSMNVSDAVHSGGLWHVSMNEGLSASDRYATEFDASSTFFRGFDEELNLEQSNIMRAELFEPFLEYYNFEIGIAGAAYTSLNLKHLCRRAELAADIVLETDQLFALPATADEITNFVKQERNDMTDVLAFCLQSVLIRGITATE